MNKIKLFFAFIVVCLISKLSAQLYVNSAGAVSVGSLVSAPSAVSLQVVGTPYFLTFLLPLHLHKLVPEMDFPSQLLRIILGMEITKQGYTTPMGAV